MKLGIINSFTHDRNIVPIHCVSKDGLYNNESMKGLMLNASLHLYKHQLVSILTFFIDIQSSFN
ncbi:unnamed protein product [Blumeria hordei]|uniref:Uncharacterized protein n=1 Tax=Blumeria hordei TaxID=2867405 RepID=A0A383UV07_BLUHO|nr:unnamed protein product [Blumeria hordei]